MPLGFPALNWLDDTRKADLASRVASCVRAMDGSPALETGGGAMLRPEGFIPVSLPLVA